MQQDSKSAITELERAAANGFRNTAQVKSDPRLQFVRTSKEFAEMAVQRGRRLQCDIICVPDAMEALASGDGSTHDRLIAEAAPQLTHCDVIMLAQFSMARAHAKVQQAVDSPVLTSPASAVAKLKVALS